MAETMVVHSIAPDAVSGDEVARRLNKGGISVLDQQQHMMLVQGNEASIKDALGDARGWIVSPLTETPPPSTRQKALRRP